MGQKYQHMGQKYQHVRYWDAGTIWSLGLPKNSPKATEHHQLDTHASDVVTIWSLEMFRNHQDGYPYINLSQFVFLKINRNVNFFWKIYWSMNSGPRWAGDC